MTSQAETNTTKAAIPPTWRRTLAVSLVGSLLLWLAQPPLGWWPLAWVGVVPWLVVARREAAFGRKDWLAVWLAGTAYWLAALWWVCLPHPLTPIGWLFLCAYLGCYPLAFVAIVRRCRRVPVWVVAPAAWVALEFVQAHLFSGFLMGAPSHSQIGRIWLIQVAWATGAYGVSGMLILMSSLLSEWRRLSSCIVLGMYVGLLFALSATVHERRHTRRHHNEQPTIALIQGDTRATWDPDPERHRRIMDRQVALSREALRQAQSEGMGLDLVVWPESMFRTPLITFGGGYNPPEGVDIATTNAAANTLNYLRGLSNELGAAMLVGIDRFDYLGAAAPDPEFQYDVYNSAALVSADGDLTAVYDKTHRVPFGEYIPLAEGMPALYYLTPMAGGLRPGAGPVAMPVETASGETVNFATNICYESVVPHVIRRHVRELTEAGAAPDVLVNVTNDAWFWGASELDMHLACDIFRAVETRTPMIVAANGGLSAVIDASGRVVEKGPRMAEHVIVARVPARPISGPSFYVRYGDWFAWCCLIVTAGAVMMCRRGVGIHGSGTEETDG
ncbi:Apolipoprotein N-acyltransferase [Pseudobythopirellula maris]|uniref:Apolipoprotein N-acyltransferase n=1 Tax=Pseudobythopirellula maris TaxID=2527991 RepID=A0A5C5ZND3_9BACT|nr:apolipoprotein N-acyltransferase [Pseudobythopirellula maris]TWT89002.1 Apolipoprotein N-acyltransferase [Pseudobythopirellula maris]